MNWIRQYTHWLHTKWPAGKPEKLPVVQPDGGTNVPGLMVVGDLSGVPLLKFSADTGTRAVSTILADPAFQKRDQSRTEVYDLAIIGGGVSGFAAAKEADKQGLNFVLIEASEPFSTIVNFPKGKPIYTYPTDMTPAGQVQFHEKSSVKEGLLEDLREQTLDQGITPMIARVERIKRTGSGFELQVPGQDHVKAHRVIVAIGRSGNFRKLGVPGETLDKVYNRLHDPKDYCGQDILVVGGGDSAMETAIALANCGSRVTLSYRKAEFSRPKPENIEQLLALAEDASGSHGADDGSASHDGSNSHDDGRGSVRLMMASSVQEIREDQVDLKDQDGQVQTLANDAVFAMIGREPPLEFFRKSGVKISGDRGGVWWATILFSVVFCTWLYHWKGNKPFLGLINLPQWMDLEPKAAWDWLIANLSGPIAAWFNDTATLGYTLKTSASGNSFYYTLAYCTCVVVFGLRRIKRRKTPYVKVQTYTLMAVQCLPLFILPEIILPWLGRNQWFVDGAFLQPLADLFFERYDQVGVERAYWRSYGFILAWPLMVYNWFTDAPMMGWLVLGFVQTFVAIPLLIRYFGKGSYCGWICSCGALAETMGDAHRHKMPHGPFWNKVNMIGQVFLVAAFALLALRIVGWIAPTGSVVDRPIENIFSVGFEGKTATWNGGGYTKEKADGLLTPFAVINYGWFVDLLFAGILGVAFYFHFSGRVWCRFACPLAALMHVYTRVFSRFAIISNKKKCISCNVCTSVCHQGIDVMNFANKGLPMQDPECVRCSACVQSCPTGVLDFGQVNRAGGVIAKDPAWLRASPVHMTELTVEGKSSA